MPRSRPAAPAAVAAARRRTAAAAPASGTSSPPATSRIVSMRLMSTPDVRGYSLKKLRIISPAPASSTSVSASSATTIAEVSQRRAGASGVAASAFLEDLVQVCLGDLQRRREAEEDPGREADRHQEGEDRRVHREPDPVRLADVGHRDVEQPDPDERQPRPSTRRRGTRAACSRPAAGGSPGRGSRRARCARQSRASGAPSATSSRLATLAQAMSSTKPTAPISARKTIRIGPPLKRSLNVITCSVDRLVRRPDTAARGRFAMPVISACACLER